MPDRRTKSDLLTEISNVRQHLKTANDLAAIRLERCRDIQLDLESSDRKVTSASLCAIFSITINLILGLALWL